MTTTAENIAPRGNGGGLKRAMEALNGRRALVVGLAATGLSSARFLKKCGAVVTATDSKLLKDIPAADELNALGIEVKAGGHEGLEKGGFDLVIVSPGVPHGLKVLRDLRDLGAEVISDVELAYRFMDAPVIAIAGTNGKTTTTTLLGEVLKDAGKKVFVGGNIGTPAVEFVEREMEADYCVLEISSFHLETTERFNPHVGVLLNITEDHLDRYRDFGHYAETKFRLFMNQTAADYAIVNVNDPVIASRVQKGLGKGRIIPFSVEGELKDGLSYNGGEIIFRCSGKEERYPASEIRLKGLHNIENVMAVIAAARALSVGRDEILATLKRFAGLSHRMEFFMERNGVAYIDDSKGTNIGSLMMALRGLKGPVILIAGGVDKGGDYRVLTSLVKEKVALMVLIGEARFKIKEALGSLTLSVMAESLKEAVEVSEKNAKAGDTVLLCPACSSFDMFRNYKERGDKFKEFVRAL
ncbi:MAG: UDP-N-acetylmuramoyl-L-alanine--D-glutamate ligase [Deltaproteobacteria bacterium]|nr:UDP-N-acetylmuramoyl-L-alanine--D-glutamate ligase [Deltaproteobacteria bacterium]